MSIFGAEFEQIWPLAGTALKCSDFGRQLLHKCASIEKPLSNSISSVDELIESSTKFPISFATNNSRVVAQPKDRHENIKQQIASAYPVIHERVLFLYLAFLQHKCEYGNKIELDVFTKLSLTDFVQRLLAKRCVSFFGRNDKYQLLSGETGASGFVPVGSENEKPPLLLKNVLSYAEIKLSALLSVSSHSEFINDGNRRNEGIVETDKSKIEREGVIIGIIGARLSRRCLMEFEDIVISKEQNSIENGYGSCGNASVDTRVKDYRRIWNEFYDSTGFVFNEVSKDGKRFGDSRNKNDIFDNVVMKKRYTISFDTLLLESEARALAAGKQAYIHVVGIGLGVWKTAEQQEKIFLETFTQRLKVLLPKLSHVGVVHFSWFHLNKWRELENGGIFKSETHPQGGIRTFLSKRNPADKLQMPEQENMLLIVSYAWDGNALPGNEYWTGLLSSTGDSSTACSTLVTELHNPFINTKFVNGENLHIASEQHGVIHVGEYAKKILDST